MAYFGLKWILKVLFVCEGLGTTSGILIDTPTTDDSRNAKNEFLFLNNNLIYISHLWLV